MCGCNTRWAYWLCVVLVSAFAWNVFTDLVAALLWTVLYLLVAVLRARDAGLSKWYGLRVLIPFIGLWEFVHLGIAPTGRYSQSVNADVELPTAGADTPRSMRRASKWLLVAACVASGLAVLTIIGFVVRDIIKPSGSETVGLGQGTDCDTLLQAQLVTSPLATVNAGNANQAIISIQAQRGDDCPVDAWNPEVVSTTAHTATFPVFVPRGLSDSTAHVLSGSDTFRASPARDNVGNIGLNFRTVGVHSANGRPVTKPMDGASRWMFIAPQGQWYTARSDQVFAEGDPGASVVSVPAVTPSGALPAFPAPTTRVPTVRPFVVPATVASAARSPTSTPVPTPSSWQKSGNWYRDYDFESDISRLFAGSGVGIADVKVATMDVGPAASSRDLFLTLACVGDERALFISPYSFAVPGEADAYVVGMWDYVAEEWSDDNLVWHHHPVVTDDSSTIYVSGSVQLRQILQILFHAYREQGADYGLSVGMVSSADENWPGLWGDFDVHGLHDALTYLGCFGELQVVRPVVPRQQDTAVVPTLVPTEPAGPPGWVVDPVLLVADEWDLDPEGMQANDDGWVIADIPDAPLYSFYAAYRSTGQESWSCVGGTPRVNVRFRRSLVLPAGEPVVGELQPVEVYATVGDHNMQLDWRLWKSRGDTIRVRDREAIKLVSAIRREMPDVVSLYVQDDHALSRNIEVAGLWEYLGEDGLSCFE